MTAQGDVLFFGCYARLGHFLWAPGPQSADAGLLPPGLQPQRVDVKLAPADRRQREGRARLHHREGWTALAWWDRAVDRRMGSNSALLVRGTHSFTEVLLAAGDAFPELRPRFAGLELVP